MLSAAASQEKANSYTRGRIAAVEINDSAVLKLVVTVWSPYVTYFRLIMIS